MTITPVDHPTPDPAPLEADLALAKTHTGAFVVGGTGFYTLVVSNVGPGTALGPITVEDQLVPELGFVSAEGDGWTCNVSGQLVVCTTAGPLGTGASLPPITITVTVAGTSGTALTNVATVSSGSSDRVVTNNSSSDSTEISAAAAEPAPSTYMARDDEMPVMVTLLSAVQRIDARAIVASSLGIISFVAVGDVITGTEISFSAFYLLPVVLASSASDARTGIRIALITALAWLGAEVVASASTLTNPMVPIWNAGVRFVVFALVVALLDALSSSVTHERELSRTDGLSGLPNSRAFYEQAEQLRRAAARSGQPLTMAYLDIDNFKAVNDSLGHSAGDAVIRSTGQSIQRLLREVDRVGRLGGDEFAILLPDTDAAGARTVLDKLHVTLGLQASGNGWPIGYSIGSVTFTSVPSSVDEMVSKSDKLMYEVKRSSKNAIKTLTAP